MSDGGDSEFEQPSCPLCMEDLDATDKNFHPCPCGYQICAWCWHQLMELAAKDSTTGRCPACRTEYKEDEIDFTAPDPNELVKKSKKKAAKAKSGSSTSINRKNLANVRVIQRNLVYVIGLSLNICKDEVLKRGEYFGKFGKIVKVSVNRSGVYNSTHGGATGSAYVTYVREDDALKCIQAVDGNVLDGKMLRCSFGTTKYCNAFLKNQPCNNPECLYLHDLGNDDDSFTKEEMVAKEEAAHGKHALFMEATHPGQLDHEEQHPEAYAPYMPHMMASPSTSFAAMQHMQQQGYSAQRPVYPTAAQQQQHHHHHQQQQQQYTQGGYGGGPPHMGQQQHTQQHGGHGPGTSGHGGAHSAHAHHATPHAAHHSGGGHPPHHGGFGYGGYGMGRDGYGDAYDGPGTRSHAPSQQQQQQEEEAPRRSVEEDFPPLDGGGGNEYPLPPPRLPPASAGSAFPPLARGSSAPSVLQEHQPGYGGGGGGLAASPWGKSSTQQIMQPAPPPQPVPRVSSQPPPRGTHLVSLGAAKGPSHQQQHPQQHNLHNTHAQQQQQQQQQGHAGYGQFHSNTGGGTQMWASGGGGGMGSPHGSAHALYGRSVSLEQLAGTSSQHQQHQHQRQGGGLGNSLFGLQSASGLQVLHVAQQQQPQHKQEQGLGAFGMGALSGYGQLPMGGLQAGYGAGAGAAGRPGGQGGSSLIRSFSDSNGASTAAAYSAFSGGGNLGGYGSGGRGESMAQKRSPGASKVSRFQFAREGDSSHEAALEAALPAPSDLLLGIRALLPDGLPSGGGSNGGGGEDGSGGAGVIAALKELDLEPGDGEGGGGQGTAGALGLSRGAVAARSQGQPPLRSPPPGFTMGSR